MSADVSIRVAGLGDIDAILRLQRKYPHIVTWTETAWSNLLGRNSVSSRKVWMTEGEGALLGFVVLNVIAEVAEFEMVLVDEAARGRGIGRKLCKLAMQWASAQGASSVELEVRQSNAAALALYASLGFTVQGTRPRYYHHPTEDAVLMGAML
jgi:ribosomal-protein-alanine N-acetyltransferase